MRRPCHVFIVLAALSFLGLHLNSLRVDSVTFRPEGSSAPATEINAPYMLLTTTPQEATINLTFGGHGSGVIRLTPRYCFSKEFRLNGVTHQFPDNQPRFCREIVMDLGKWLEPGANTLVLTTFPTDRYAPFTAGLSIGTPLFWGGGFIQSSLTMILIGSLFGLIWLGLAQKGFSRPARVIFITACGLYLQFLLSGAHFNFCLDLEKHTPYIQYLADHPFDIFTYRGMEDWHPVLHYLIYGLVARIAQMLGTFDAWTAMRFVSVVYYATFIYFGMRSILRLVQGNARYLAFALLAFWPSGLFSSAWIFNDILVYPLYSACFYYTLVWYDNGKPRSLTKALICAGLTFMVKTSAFVPATILGASIIIKLFTRRCALRDLLQRKSRMGWLALAVGLAFNWAKNLYVSLVLHQQPPVQLGGFGGYRATLDNLLPIHAGDLIAKPFFYTWEDPSLWNLHVRTSLFTNTVWQHPDLASGLQCLYLIMLGFMAIFLITLPMSKCARLFPLFAGLAVPYAASMTFALYTGMASGVDLRYTQPALIAIVTVFVLATQEMKNRGWPLLYYAGNISGAAFAALSIVFFQMQLAFPPVFVWVP